MSTLHEFWRREKHRLRPLLRLSSLWRRARIALPLDRLPVSSRYFGRPKGCYPDGEAYARAERGRSAGARHVAVYPAETLEREPPRVIAGALPPGARERGPAHFAAAGVTIIPHGRHWGFYGGTIITPDDRVLLDVSRDVWQWPGHTVRTRFALPRCRRLAGVTASLTTPEAEANYWHWTTELLPRIHLLAAAGFPPERVDRYLVNTSGARYQRETLAALGIPPERIVVASSSTHFECETLLVPSMNQCDEDVPRWAVAWLRELAPASAGARRRRLFLSRADAGFRRLLNEEQVVAALAPYGFEVLNAGALDVAAQRQACAEAELVVGPHGAAFTNTVWCRPGTRIVELMPADYCYLSFWALAAAAGLTHTILLGERLRGPGRRRFSDFTIEPELVRRTIAAQLAAPEMTPPPG